MKRYYLLLVLLSVPTVSTAADLRKREQCSSHVYSRLSSNGSMACNSDALAQCLIDADDEFYACERICDDLNPDDSAEYNECRNGCRDTLSEERNACYDNNCSAGLSICKTETEARDVDTLARYYMRFRMAERCSQAFKEVLTAEQLSTFKAAIDKFSATIGERGRQSAWGAARAQAEPQVSSEICVAAADYIKEFDPFITPSARDINSPL